MRRLLTGILCLIMVFTMMPMVQNTAYAETPNYLCFMAEEGGSTISLNWHNIDVSEYGWFGYDTNKSIIPASLEYSTDGEYWSTYSIDPDLCDTCRVFLDEWSPDDTILGKTITLSNVGDRVYFRATDTNSNFSYSSSQFYRFQMSGNISASGNVMSLLDRDNFETFTDLSAESYNNCFIKLFSGCSALTQAPELPAMKLSKYCYQEMFAGCTSLQAAPALPATELNNSCYNSMFYNCTSLKNAPMLSATTLANHCYFWMFKDCTSLETAPALPATKLASDCYNQMFSGCTSLKQAPALSATELAAYCYNWMFNGCTSLKEAPALPATELASNCYNSMFNNCTSLTTPPELKAATLAEYCYYNMFYGCSKLYMKETTAGDINALWVMPSVVGDEPEGWNTDMLDATANIITVSTGKSYVNLSDYAWYDKEKDKTDSVFYISTIEELEVLSKIVNDGAFDFSNRTVMLSDTFNDKTTFTTPIGTSEHPFRGIFNGNGKTINLRINSVKDDAGLFGVVENGVILNVSTKGAVSSTGKNVGGIVGTNNTGTGTNYEGYEQGGTIINCFSTASVSGSQNAGGIVGSNNGFITNCYAAAAVSGTPSGGVAGNNAGIVTNCFSNRECKIGCGIQLSDSQMKAAGGATNSDWVEIGAYGKCSMVDALFGYLKANYKINYYDSGDYYYDINKTGCNAWSAAISLPADAAEETKEAFNNGYPVFAIDVDGNKVYLLSGSAYSDNSCNYNDMIPFPSGISYKDGSYIIDNCLYPITDLRMDRNSEEPLAGLYFLDETANIEIIGENQIGVNTTDIKMQNAVWYGIYAEGTLNFSGDGNLTIFDLTEGIMTKNEYNETREQIIFGKDFTGKLIIHDAGELAKNYCCCCLNADDVVIHNGLFYLNNYGNKGIMVDTLTIDGGIVNVKGKDAAVSASTSIDVSKMQVLGKSSESTVTVLYNDSSKDYVTILPTKTVTIAAGIQNGTITVDKEGAAPKDTVAISNTPASDYELDTITVYKTGNKNVKVTVTDGKFIMPDYCVTVSATFKKKQSQGTNTIGGGFYIPSYTYTKPALEDENKEQSIDPDEISDEVSNIKIRVYSKYVKVNGKRYIKPYIKVLEGEDTIQALQDAGYTIKYAFYKSTSKKTSSFKKAYTTKNQYFTDKKGTNGKYYYYKAKLLIYDENLELVTSTKLAQCKYGCRLYNEKSKNMN